MDDKRSKFIGCLLGLAIGDSLGARREGAADARVSEVADLAPRYSDDTVMAIGVAESLVEQKEFHYFHMTERLIKLYEREPWRRHGNTASRVFRMMRSGKLGFGMLDRDIYPDGSYGNGAAGRIAPVGMLYYDDPRTLRDIAVHCASITHSHELALDGAMLQAYAVALAMLAVPGSINTNEFLATLRMSCKTRQFQEKLKTVIRFLAEGSGREEVKAALGTGGSALDSVPVAIYAFLSHADFKSALLYAVSLGGDADTIGAMTGAIAGACYGAENIPSQWRETVENRDYLEQLAVRLWELKTGKQKSSP